MRSPTEVVWLLHVEAAIEAGARRLADVVGYGSTRQCATCDFTRAGHRAAFGQLRSVDAVA
jgi:hypothetical protein